ncbi:type II secretion system protein [Candidatus Nomurabacteria bacterium]|nr:type II secretion system protein [Candidatus Nomurabacteria bacterium]MCB9819381.1 type II secretion system protein [Candidatus Nomurabacteria bacterium]
MLGFKFSLDVTMVQKSVSQKGFSLIELLVSMALFTVVLTMGIGALLVLINANAKAQNTQESVSNIQFALDSMARELRTGFAFYCSSGTETTGDADTHQGCNKGTYLSIIEGGKSLTDGDNNRRIAYRFNSSSGAIERKIGTGSWVRLTNPTVDITNMHFNVSNTARKEDDGNLLQPNVTIFIEGEVAGIGQTGSGFMLQTTITKRVLDL